VTSNDYIYVFKQSTLYKQFLQGGPPGHELDNNELLLRKAQGSNGPARLVAIVANYTSRSSFTKTPSTPQKKKGFWVYQATC